MNKLNTKDQAVTIFHEGHDYLFGEVNLNSVTIDEVEMLCVQKRKDNVVQLDTIKQSIRERGFISGRPISFNANITETLDGYGRLWGACCVYRETGRTFTIPFTAQDTDISLFNGMAKGIDRSELTHVFQCGRGNFGKSDRAVREAIVAVRLIKQNKGDIKLLGEVNESTVLSYISQHSTMFTRVFKRCADITVSWGKKPKEVKLSYIMALLIIHQNNPQAAQIIANYGYVAVEGTTQLELTEHLNIIDRIIKDTLANQY